MFKQAKLASFLSLLLIQVNSQCTFPCDTCDAPLTHCLSCASTYTYDSTAHTCTCSSYEFESIGTPNSCIACNEQCLTCSSSSVHCDTCYSFAHPENNQCICDYGYFPDSDATNCSQCYYLSCHICTGGSASDCTSCIDGNQSLPNCDCNDTYYTDATNNCQSCTSPCANCNSNATTCTSCIDTYYLSGSSCLNCQLPCKDCVDNALKCTSCFNPHQYISNNTCVCDDGYFMESGYLCSLCNHPCSKCVDNADKCLDCTTTYTISTTTANTCECPSGSYEELSNTPKDCQICTSPCQTCTGNTNYCLSCVDTNQTIDSNNLCVCNTGWMANGILCDQCLNPCTNCSGAINYCTNCKDAHHHIDTGSCICEDGWLNDANFDCQQCTSPCLTCISSITHCQSCTDINHFINATFQCICKDKYYSDTISTCTACTEPCDNCDINGCLTCIDTNQIINSLQCICKDGYYMVGVNCSQCQLPCASCVTTSDHCLTCVDANQIIISDQCVCQDGYYMENYHCYACQLTCVKCISQNNCFECIAGYYLDIGICVVCDTKCTTCIDSSSCQTCADNYSMNDENDCIQCINNCKECNNSLSCNICKEGYYQLEGNCHECNQNCLTCITSPENCLSCTQDQELAEQKCKCKTGYYEVENSCLICSYPCIDCQNQHICSQCATLSNLIMTKDNICICKDGYFWQENICLQCESSCQTCLTKNICVGCDQSINRILKDHKCQCFDDYYQDNNNICTSCHSDQGKITESCKYHDCSDLVWTYGEECDDGNDIVRDGCSNCKIDINYTCENVILQQSMCFQCPINCLKCELHSNSKTVQCKSCLDGYYEDKQQCVKCSEKCLGCKNSASNCIQCRFHNESQSGDCQFCESKQGYYFDLQNNKCYSRCGDYFKAFDEECDDGNLFSGDGCDRYCNLENKFLCQDGICITPKYPIPTLSISGDSSVYNNFRQFNLSYDKKLNISKQFNLTEQVEFNVLSNGIQSQNYYPISISQWLEKDQNNLISLSALIGLTLNQTSQGEILILNFKNSSLILSSEGYSQLELNITSSISNYILIDQITVQMTSTAISSNKYMLYIIGGMAGGSILFGGIHIFYNILDVIQMISFLKYINIKMPYNLQYYFDFYKFAQLNFFQKFYNLQSLIDPYIDYSKLRNIPEKIANDELNSLFIINGSSILTAWISLFGVYALAQFLLKIFNQQRIKYNSEILHHNIWLMRLKLYYLKGKIYLIKKCYNIVSEFFFNGILRMYISLAYDYTFSTILQITALQLKSEDFLVRLSSILSLVALTVYLLMIYFVIKISNLGKYVGSNEQYSKKYGTVFEGIRKKFFSQYFNTFLLIKKLLFMITLIVIYSYPMFQVTGQALISILQVIFLCIFKPLENSYEYYKELASEISISMTLLQLSILAIDEKLKYFNYDQRQQIGWGCIIFISSILIVQIVLDAIQQWQLIIRKLKKPQTLVNKMKKLFQSPIKQGVNHSVFEQV